MMGTTHAIAKRLKEAVGILIPHPEPETIHLAKEDGIHLPCNDDIAGCPFACNCEVCDGVVHIGHISDPAELVEYLVSSYELVRVSARDRYSYLIRTKSF